MPEPLQVREKPYKIIDDIKETPDVNVFRLKTDDDTRIKFDPGMFVMLTYVDPITKAKVARAFSIASAPSTDYLEFFISMIHGRFTSHLDTAHTGDVYYVTGPYGQFRFIPGMDKKVLFIAGGTGLAPFMSMLREIRELKSGNDVALIYSVRYPNEIIRREELSQLSNEITLKSFVTVTRPQVGDGWAGQTGHIDANMIKSFSSDYMERTPYICGPLPFVKAVKDALVDLGMPAGKIKADVWG